MYCSQENMLCHKWNKFSDHSFVQYFKDADNVCQSYNKYLLLLKNFVRRFTNIVYSNSIA